MPSPTDEHAVQADRVATVELVEEELHASTRLIQSGEITIRRELVTETRTIEVPVRREELVIERHPVERRAMADGQESPHDSLVQELMLRLRDMRDGDMLRIPIFEEEVIVTKRPVVVEEITVRKHSVADTQMVSGTIRREVARIEEHGDVPAPASRIQNG